MIITEQFSVIVLVGERDDGTVVVHVGHWQVRWSVVLAVHVTWFIDLSDVSPLAGLVRQTQRVAEVTCVR